MSKTLPETVRVQQLEFVLTIEDSDSAVMDLEFLRKYEIVPSDWKTAQPETTTEEIVLNSFRNGIYILKKSNQIAFLEDIGSKNFEELQVSRVVLNYIEKSAHLKYHALGVNIQGYVTLNNSLEARNYLLSNFFNPQCKHESDQGIIQASANFVYKLETGYLNLSVTNTELELLDEGNVALIFFSANFQTDVFGISQEEQLTDLLEAIENWRAYVAMYQEIIDGKFFSNQIEQVV